MITYKFMDDRPSIKYFFETEHVSKAMMINKEHETFRFIPLNNNIKDSKILISLINR